MLLLPSFDVASETGALRVGIALRNLHILTQGQEGITLAEFDRRLGQAFAAGTDAELAAATADLPVMPIAAEPPKPAAAQGEPRIPRPGIVLTAATVVYAAVWPVVFLLPKDGEGDPQGGLTLVMLASFSYVILLLLIGTPILADWLNERW